MLFGCGAAGGASGVFADSDLFFLFVFGFSADADFSVFACAAFVVCVVDDVADGGLIDDVGGVFGYFGDVVSVAFGWRAVGCFFPVAVGGVVVGFVVLFGGLVSDFGDDDFAFAGFFVAFVEFFGSECDEGLLDVFVGWLGWSEVEGVVVFVGDWVFVVSPADVVEGVDYPAGGAGDLFGMVFGDRVFEFERD